MSWSAIPKEPSFQFYTKSQNLDDAFLRGRRETDVFAAESYFKGDLCTSQEQVFTGKESSVSIARRSAMLNNTKSRSRKQDKTRGVAIFNCSCTGNDSVDIGDHDYVSNWNRASSSAGNQPYSGGDGAFGTPLSIWTPIHDLGKLSLDFQKKWGEKSMYYESDSDESSDLFEIENLSPSRGYPIFSDDFSGERKGYEGRVVTASTADNSDTTTDEYTKQGMINNDDSNMRRKLYVKLNIFSGCKAFGVLGNALRETRTYGRRSQLKVSDAGGII